MAIDTRTELEEALDLYSDMHKDVFGIRPSLDPAWTAAQVWEEIADLERYWEAEEEHEQRHLAEAAIEIALDRQFADHGEGWRLAR